MNLNQRKKIEFLKNHENQLSVSLHWDSFPNVMMGSIWFSRYDLVRPGFVQRVSKMKPFRGIPPEACYWK